VTANADKTIEAQYRANPVVAVYVHGWTRFLYRITQPKMLTVPDNIAPERTVDGEQGGGVNPKRHVWFARAYPGTTIRLIGSAAVGQTNSNGTTSVMAFRGWAGDVGCNQSECNFVVGDAGVAPAQKFRHDISGAWQYYLCIARDMSQSIAGADLTVPNGLTCTLQQPSP
jgi:hypothetical protein